MSAGPPALGNAALAAAMCSLARPPQPASVSVAVPTGLRCDFTTYVDGVLVAQSPRGAIEVTAGRHVVRAESEGDRCIAGQTAIELRRGEHQALHVADLR